MSETHRSDEMHAAVADAAEALSELAESRPQIAVPLARLVAAVANEARRTPRFATTLIKSLAVETEPAVATSARRSGRRSPGTLDPFAVFSNSGEAGLRDRLSLLDLEQLRDIIAEHGMDQDRLAMKWKDASRVVERIIERVVARTAKGSAFRNIGR